MLSNILLPKESKIKDNAKFYNSISISILKEKYNHLVIDKEYFEIANSIYYFYLEKIQKRQERLNNFANQIFKASYGAMETDYDITSVTRIKEEKDENEVFRNFMDEDNVVVNHKGGKLFS